MLMTPNEYIRKLQKEASMVAERDLGEEAEDEILKSTGKIDFTQDSEYIRLFDDDDEKLMECVYKKELGSNFETIVNGVGVGTYESESNEETLEGKGDSPHSTETSR
jgi:hypothetical protein